MKTSLILTINNRSPQVSRLVAESFALPGNKVDETIVVLDRVDLATKGGAEAAYTSLKCPVRFVETRGLPGWRGPAMAWNIGFAAAQGDLLYCISSEVVQNAGNVETARALAADFKTVVFGACHNSTPVNLVVGAEPGLLVSSKMPRPLGFIACLPRWAVKRVGGFDEAFMGTDEAPGYWYDDDDFYLRLWQTGLDFLFDDSIHGIHLDHPRPILDTPLGQAGIARNASLMMEKHHTAHPWPNLPKIVEHGEKRLRWKNPKPCA